jgi:hypothetical protein
MRLVDTSVWVNHFKTGEPELTRLLETSQILMHPGVIGELALGTLRQRETILSALKDLPQAVTASEEEVLESIERHQLFGMGIGYIDAHLLASARLNAARLWTHDKRLHQAAIKLQCAHE